MAANLEQDIRAVLGFDDLHVGQRFVSGTHVIDEEQIKAFARQFDPQPFHLDAAAAKQSLFEGLVASGWHTAAITMRLLVDQRQELLRGVRIALLDGGQDARDFRHNA